MSVGQDLVGKVFHTGQYSQGTVSDTTTDPVAYTESNAAPGSQYGAGDLTITSVTTDQNGVTTVNGTIETSLGPVQATGTVIGNDTDDLLINGTIAPGQSFQQSGFFFLTNKPASANSAIAGRSAAAAATTTGAQPGVGNTALVAAERENITYNPNASVACFASGTSIATPTGGVAVENLVAGDLVLTASGVARPVRWIGHRTIRCRTSARPDAVLPIRIEAHAFAPSRPERDLLVSPGHAILVEAMGEILVPACVLVNGTTIAQVDIETVTYWHVELDSHDILLAENLPTESYLEMGNRGFFAEAGVVDLSAAPDAPVPTHADFCRPFHDRGPLVDAVRARLTARAAAARRETATPSQALASA